MEYTHKLMQKCCKRFSFLHKASCLKDEEKARADDKADIHKMIFWRARVRIKKYGMEHDGDGDGVIHQSNTLHTNSLFRQSSFIQMEIFWYWKFPYAKHERRRSEFLLLTQRKIVIRIDDFIFDSFFISGLRKSFYIESRFVFSHFLSIYWNFAQIEWE